MSAFSKAPIYQACSSNVPGPQPTERNLSLARERVANRAAITEPLEGDFIRRHDNTWCRISHCWDDTVQTCKDGSFYLCDGGGCDYSGTLYPGVDRTALVATDEAAMGGVWFFHHGFAGAHLGVYFLVPVRVWTLKPGTDDSRCVGFGVANA